MCINFKKSYQLLVFVIISNCFIGLSGCTKVSTTLELACSVTSVKADAVVIHSTLSPVKQGVGIQLTVTINDSIVDRFNRLHNGSTDFNITGLKANTSYKVEMKVINDPAIKADVCTASFTTLLSNIPLVNTSTISNIDSAGATVAGEVAYEGAAPVTERGILWALGTNPHTYNHRVLAGAGLGTFTATLNIGFQPNTKYYVKAYAVNSAGYGYGADSTFTTLP